MNGRFTESDYAEAIGVLRELEKKLMSKEQWQRAIDAADAFDALKVMGGDYDFASLRSPEAYEPVLQAKLKETYDLLYTICAEPAVVDVLNAKYVFHNLKVIVKSSVSEHAKANGDSILSEISAVTPQQMHSEKTDKCPEYILEARREMLEAYAATHDPQSIDMTADRHMFQRMLTLCDEMGNEFITGYVQRLIDLYNLKLLMRVKNMQLGVRFLQNALLPGGLTDTDILLDSYDKPFSAIAVNCYYKYFGTALKLAEDSYEKTKNFSTLEKLADNLLIEHMRQAKYIAFGPEPLFAYILARENEIRQIRIVITCKINNISEDTLRERLRDHYA